MKIHIFNPEHDIALAADSIFWTAPHAGRQLRSDLGWIPALWADDGDIIIVDDINAANSANRKYKSTNKCVCFTTMQKLSSTIRKCYASDTSDNDTIIKEEEENTTPNNRDIIICPWGWDKSIWYQLKRSGIPENMLPNTTQLAAIRNLSDRKTASELLYFLRSSLNKTCGDAYCVENFDDIHTYLSKLEKIVVKSPWSSSGRGVRYLSEITPNATKWIEKTIKTMGHVMIEPYLNKILDFGMEFTVLSDGDIQYNGLSLFSTSNGAYTGNMLATEEEKTAILVKYIEKQQLVETKELVMKWLKKKIAKNYVGPLGIDMMITSNKNNACDTSEYLLNPCVEINLRRTMGHVALCLSPKENGLGEIMNITYEGNNYHLRITNNHEIFI